MYILDYINLTMSFSFHVQQIYAVCFLKKALI